MKSTRIELYHFVCPQCGMGDGELDHLATADDMHCVVCLIDEDQYVRLRRWLAEEAAAQHQLTE